MHSLTDFPVPLLGFAAFSGTGKTTLLTKLLPLLTAKGIRVGMVKHSHHDIEMDQPGKDSYRLRKAGACQMVLASPHRSIIFAEKDEQKEPKLVDQLNWLDLTQLDLVLVEGFRHEAFPKIELHRPSLNKPLLCQQDPNIIAIATDKQLTNIDLPQFDLNNIEQIAAFVNNYREGIC